MAIGRMGRINARWCLLIWDLWETRLDSSPPDHDPATNSATEVPLSLFRPLSEEGWTLLYDVQGGDDGEIKILLYCEGATR